MIDEILNVCNNCCICITVEKDFKQHEERMEALVKKMLLDNQKKMQLFIKEEFIAYEKAFTRKISECKCRGENSATKLNVIDDALEKEMFSRFSLPLNSTEELLQWNTAIKDEAYHKFMVSLLYIYGCVCVCVRMCVYLYIYLFCYSFRKITLVHSSAWMGNIERQKMRPWIAFRGCFQWI